MWGSSVSLVRVSPIAPCFKHVLAGGGGGGSVAIGRCCVYIRL